MLKQMSILESIQHRQASKLMQKARLAETVALHDVNQVMIFFSVGFHEAKDMIITELVLQEKDLNV